MTIVFTAGRRYDVVVDHISRRIVFARGAVTDDADGRPVAPPWRAQVDEPLLDASDHAGGYALAGDPGVALTDTSVAHPLAVAITVTGYHPAAATVTIPAAPVLPVNTPIALRRLPVRLSGRVLAAATDTPVPGAAVALTGPALPLPARALLLSPPLAAALTAAASLQGRAINPVASPVAIKTARAAAAATIEITLDDVQNLAATQLLRIGPPERAHWVRIAAVTATSVRLTMPLALSVRDGDPAAPFTLGAVAGPAAAPIGDAFAGEGVVIVDAAATGPVIAVTDGALPLRFHDLGVIAGPGGDYAIAGLARLASLRLTITAAGFTSQTRTVLLPREAAAAASSARLDWRLLP